MPDTIGFIGLGKMGMPMARNLLAAGHRLRVHDRDPGRAAELVALDSAGSGSAVAVDSPAECGSGGDLVISMVPDDRAALEIVTGPRGLGESLRHGGTHLSTSTLSPECAQRL